VVLHFDRFVLDAGARRLLRGGREVHLSPKAFDLLQLLVSRRPNAVSKAEIQDALWPSTHVVEANVANLAGEVRRALRDDQAEPRFVRTVPRFGYAFMHPAVGDEAAGSFCLVTHGAQYRLAAGVNILGRTMRDGSPFNSETISRRHASIVVDGTSAVIQDHASKNGTFVNGDRVTAGLALKDGDVIRLGSVEVSFCLQNEDTPTVSLLEL